MQCWLLDPSSSSLSWHWNGHQEPVRYHRHRSEARSLTEVTGKGMVQVPIELCSMGFLQSSAQTEIWQFHVALETKTPNSVRIITASEAAHFLQCLYFGKEQMCSLYAPCFNLTGRYTALSCSCFHHHYPDKALCPAAIELKSPPLLQALCFRVRANIPRGSCSPSTAGSGRHLGSPQHSPPPPLGAIIFPSATKTQILFKAPSLSVSGCGHTELQHWFQQHAISCLVAKCNLLLAH